MVGNGLTHDKFFCLQSLCVMAGASRFDVKGFQGMTFKRPVGFFSKAP